MSELTAKVRFDRALAAEEARLDSPEPELLPVRLARACLAVLPVDGAGICVLDGDFRVPLGASDETAGLVERLQFTQGEGPCLEAANSGRAVVAGPDELMQRWPSFAAEMFRYSRYCAVVSWPLTLSTSTAGALDLFVDDPEAVSVVRLQDVSEAGTSIERALRGAPRAVTTLHGEPIEDDGPVWLNAPASDARRLVWLAMGLVMNHLDVDAQDALALLRGYSYSENTTLDQTADDLVDGRLSLSRLRRD